MKQLPHVHPSLKAAGLPADLCSALLSLLLESCSSWRFFPAKASCFLRAKCPCLVPSKCGFGLDEGGVRERKAFIHKLWAVGFFFGLFWWRGGKKGKSTIPSPKRGIRDIFPTWALAGQCMLKLQICGRIFIKHEDLMASPRYKRCGEGLEQKWSADRFVLRASAKVVVQKLISVVTIGFLWPSGWACYLLCETSLDFCWES